MTAPTPNLVFLDTETTSLRPDRRAWEVATILRRPGAFRADPAERRGHRPWLTYPCAI